MVFDPSTLGRSRRHLPYRWSIYYLTIYQYMIY